jgi:hypothetical protein
MASARLTQKALETMAELLSGSAKGAGPDDIARIAALLKKNKDVAKVINIISGLPTARFSGSAGRLAVPTETAQEMSEFVVGLSKNPRTLTKKDFPKVARALGLQPLEGVVYGRGGRLPALSKKAHRQMMENIEAAAFGAADGVPGDPNFYWTGNRLITGSVPDMDPGMAALTFAPFSASTAVPENIRRWQRFIENPEMFPGRFPGEGGLTVGGAWADALRVMGREAPQVSDLSTSGNVVKVGSFGENLWLPGSSRRATVDRHAVKNALGIYIPDDVKVDGKKLELIPDLGDPETYRNIERGFIDVADAHGMMPHETQSAGWDVWRRWMQANPDAALMDAAAFNQLNVSPIFDLPTNQRRSIVSKVVSDIHNRDEAWLRRAGLL